MMKIIMLSIALAIIVLFVVEVNVPDCTQVSQLEEPSEEEKYVDVWGGEVDLEDYQNYPINTLMEINTFGNSMNPTIRDKSVCRCVVTGNYEKEDIVSYWVLRENKIINILHRIHNKEGEQYITLGDNNGRLDEPITEEQIICEVPNIKTKLINVILNKIR